MYIWICLEIEIYTWLCFCWQINWEEKMSDPELNGDAPTGGRDLDLNNVDDIQMQSNQVTDEVSLRVR